MIIDLDEVYKGGSVANNVTRVYKGGDLIFERGVGPVLDPATQALIDQAAIDGYTAASGAVLTALDTFIKQLKADGIWALLDVIWLPATNGDSDFAIYNLKDPTIFQLTKVNSPTFTSLEGFTGDGATSYLNTLFNLSTDSANYVLNSASIGVYQRLNPAVTAATWGCRDASNGTLSFYNRPSGNNFIEINNSIGSGQVGGFSGITNLGLICGS